MSDPAGQSENSGLGGNETAGEAPGTWFAVAAVISGVLGMIAIPYLAPIAIVLGAVTLFRARRRQTPRIVKGAAIVGMSFGCIGIAIGYAAIAYYRELSDRAVCSWNLKVIGHAILVYTAEFPEQGVPHPAFLAETARVRFEESICPRSSEPKRSYVVVAGRIGSADNKAPMIAENPENHAQGGYVLYSDGTVEWAVPEKLKQLTEERTAH